MKLETRITPAGAGKTKICIVKVRISKDHPRRCGENANPEEAYCRRQGSPPQVRGKPLKKKLRCIMLRITPAGAGKTVVYFRKMLAI